MTGYPEHDFQTIEGKTKHVGNSVLQNFTNIVRHATNQSRLHSANHSQNNLPT